MTHNLYRFYLYTIFIALLIFAAVAIGRLLNIVLALTPLRDSSTSIPASADIVQAIVFAVVSLLIASILGGLHYWLIRRDMLHNPDAINSGIRAFFLNVIEAIGIALAVPIIGYQVFGTLGVQSSSVEIIGALAVALPALGIVLFLELERRRTPITTTSGAALAFQRFHFYGVQILLLVFLTFSLLFSFRPLVDALFFGGTELAQDCSGLYCPSYNPAYLAVSILWFVIYWVSYGMLTIGDRSALPRLILHGVSFAYGIAWILAGVYLGFELIISPLFKLSHSLHDILGSGARYNFISPLVLGLLVVGIYHLWLRNATRQSLMRQEVMSLTEYAIVVVLASAMFWWGCGYILYNVLQTLIPAPSGPDNGAWVSSIAFIIAGPIYIPLDLYLRRRGAADTSAAGPRRGLVLALLGGGILALAIGGATALYAWVTSLFGSPISNWQQVTHVGLAAFLVGALLIGFYLSGIKREHLFASFGKRPATTIASVPPPPTPPAEKTIEEVLDELLTGSMTRDEAARRIRALSNVSIPVSEVTRPLPAALSDPI